MSAIYKENFETRNKILLFGTLYFALKYNIDTKIKRISRVVTTNTNMKNNVQSF